MTTLLVNLKYFADKKSTNYTIVNSRVSPIDGGIEIKVGGIYKNPEKPLIEI